MNSPASFVKSLLAQCCLGGICEWVVCPGARNVALVAGYNKLVKDLAEAQHRLETMAAPANAQRLACKTPCAQTGVCANCQSPARICCDYLVLRQQRQKGRIRVILVAGALGF